MRVSLQFGAPLRQFLAYAHRDVTFEYTFEGVRSIKDLVESLGVPHTEVGQFIVNQHSVAHGYIVRDGDQINVHARERTALQHEARFVLDIHLGRLAAYLRMLGFDTLYPEEQGDANLARICSAESRILLTRDIGLLKRNLVQQGYFVRATAPQQQLAEVLEHYHLLHATSPFSRCTHCNTPLQLSTKAELQSRLPANTLEHYDEFRLCPSCDKVYWKGSHYDKLQMFLQQLRAASPHPTESGER
jgi:uncharacterized protein